jgi:CheY-like chemotaxis protein
MPEMATIPHTIQASGERPYDIIQAIAADVRRAVRTTNHFAAAASMRAAEPDLRGERRSTGSSGRPKPSGQDPPAHRRANAAEAFQRRDKPNEVVMADRPLSNCRVLIAEDDFNVAQDLSGAVRALGGAVVGPVANRGDALALARRERPHLAVLDIDLGGETSFPVADVLDALDVPYLFATGYGRPVIPSPYGHAPCWTKPYDSASLAAALPALLGPHATCEG